MREEPPGKDYPIMKHLLITGFDPFGGESVNPSWEAVRALPETIGDIAIHKLQLPTVFGKAPDKVLERADDLKPDAVLSVGQAGGRSGVTVEYVAINLRHARIADNAGKSPQDQPVVPGGPAAYFATVPVRRMVSAVEAAGIPCAASYTAGTFVCNEVLYSLLHRFAGGPTLAGFIHLPYLPEQAVDGQPSLPLADMVKALEAAIGVLFEA